MTLLQLPATEDGVGPGPHSVLFHPTTIWLSSSTLACLLCLYQFSATLVGGEFIPADHDSFYHARRILSALTAPMSVMQFDPNIHAPQGSWITWPWAFDAMMAAIGSSLMLVTGSTEPMRVLAFIAPAWVFINGALLLAIGRSLHIAPGAQVLLMLCFALSPLTPALHRVGMLDHHFVEYSFVLATLWIGLRWFGDLENCSLPVWCGAILGSAPAFHNGLFILQLPVLIMFFLLWVAGRPLPRKSVHFFGLSLVLVTTLFLVFSEPFQDGKFSFYLHSWFHIYIALCSALIAFLLTRLAPRPVNFCWLVMVGFLLLLPIIPQVLQGSSFLHGDIIEYDSIIETRSIWHYIATGRWQTLTRLYSGLLWLLPIALGSLFWQLRQHNTNADLFFLVMCIFGTLLLAAQFRLQYFGSFALPLAGLVVADRVIRVAPGRRKPLAVIAMVVIALAHIAPLRALGDTYVPGSDFQYAVLRNSFLALGSICAQDPGLVLAEHGVGHYITYHTDCSVIANNFILTKQHQESVLHSRYLFSLTPEEVIREAPDVRYIFVARADNVLDEQTCHPGCIENAGLREALLGDVPVRSKNIEILFEQHIQGVQQRSPLVRIYAINRD